MHFSCTTRCVLRHLFQCLFTFAVDRSLTDATIGHQEPSNGERLWKSARFDAESISVHSRCRIALSEYDTDQNVSLVALELVENCPCLKPSKVRKAIQASVTLCRMERRQRCPQSYRHRNPTMYCRSPSSSNYCESTVQDECAAPPTIHPIYVKTNGTSPPSLAICVAQMTSIQTICHRRQKPLLTTWMTISCATKLLDFTSLSCDPLAASSRKHSTKMLTSRFEKKPCRRSRRFSPHRNISRCNIYGSSCREADVRTQVLLLHDTLLTALSRMFHEEGKRHIHVAIHITSVFAQISNYPELHSVIVQNKMGSGTLSLLEYILKQCIPSRQERFGDICCLRNAIQVPFRRRDASR